MKQNKYITKTKQKLINKQAKVKARYDSMRESVFRSNRIEVPYPTSFSEAEIQASLWSSLRKLGMDVRMEVKHQIKPQGTPTRMQLCRFDLVVYVNRKALCIIEVKSDKLKKRGAITQAEAKQMRKYAKYDAELIYCIGRMNIEKTIQEVKEMHRLILSNKLEYSKREISPLTVQSAGGDSFIHKEERLIGAALVA